MGHPKADLSIRVHYGSTEELHNLLEKISGMPHVRDVEWSEEIRVLDRDPDALFRKVFFGNSNLKTE